MKNTIFIACAGLMFLFACQDSILDKKPLDSMTDAQVWQDPNLIESYLSNLYKYTPVLVQGATTVYTQRTVNGSQFNWQNSEQGGGPFLLNEASDESKTGWGYLGNSQGVRLNGIGVNGGFMEYWPYGEIRNINIFLDKLPTANFPDNLKVLRAAEARFLRAFNYFAMVKRYGGVPIITKVQGLDTPKEELYPKRNSEKEVYDFIISEMDAIANDLAATTEFGRPNKWAALSLKARAALYAGSIARYGKVQLDGLLGFPASDANVYFQKAYDASKAIMDSHAYSLYNGDADKTVNFQNIFLKKQNPEVIFAKLHDVVDALDAGGNAWAYDFLQCPKPHAWGAGMKNTPYLEMAEEFEKADGTSGKLNRAQIQQGLWTIDQLWGGRDPRFYATIWTEARDWKGTKIDFHNGLIDPNGTLLENTGQGYGGINARGTQDINGQFHTGFGVMKYLDENTDNVGGSLSNASSDYIVFRYGETLLNFAEAAYELNKPAEAMDAINQLRNRAGVAPLSSISMDAIRHERKVELAFEGHRYWDVRRWRIATDALTTRQSGLRYILDYNTRKYKLIVLTNIDGTQPVFQEKNYYFPITPGRIAQNPNLVENPGY